MNHKSDAHTGHFTEVATNKWGSGTSPTKLNFKVPPGKKSDLEING